MKLTHTLAASLIAITAGRALIASAASDSQPSAKRKRPGRIKGTTTSLRANWSA